jgi:hypothetical protein
MVISDIFSSSFLFSIAIIVILIGGIFAYVSYRMTEQDHKLTSMVNVVSLLVQDLQFVKSKLNNKSTNDDNNDNDDNNNNANIKYSSDIMGGDLISVSDCEDEDEEEEEDDDQEDDQNQEEDDDQNDEEDQDEDLDIGDIDIGEETNDTIKLLNLSLVNNDPMEDHEINILDETEYHNDNNDNNDINTTKTIHLDFAEETDEKQELNDDIIKSIGAEIDIEDLNKTDYKKMSLNKLRELVVSKGIVNDASKLKKHDILKLLGEE